MSTRRCASELALTVSLMLVAGPAMGQATSAEELFKQGKDAIERLDYEKACNFFQASLDAEYTLGTLLNLAICHEHQGRIASAWSEYRALDDRARRATPPQTDRSRFAQTHAAALYPRLSRVRITLSPEAATIKGLSIKIDSASVARELFDVGVPVDTGQHTVTATAPDHEGWSQTITVSEEQQTVAAEIPDLAATPPPPPSADLLARTDEPPPESSRRTVGFVVGGVGLAALATGGVFGILAFSASRDATCPAPCLPTPSGDNPTFIRAHDAYERADTLGWISNIALAAGVVGVAAGAYLVITAPASRKKTALRLSPLGAGLSLGGDL